MTSGDKVANLKRRYIDMISRCYRESCNNYQHYGRRGIKVCNEWLDDRDSFIQWALENGYERQLSLDRIDNDGDYEPSNCRWTTRRMQNINKRASTPTSTGYVGISIHSSSFKQGYLYYYGRVRDKSGKAQYTGLSKSLREAVIMRNDYIITHGLANELNPIPEEGELID